MKTIEKFINKAVVNHSFFNHTVPGWRSVFVLLIFVALAAAPKGGSFAEEPQNRDILEFLGVLTTEQAKALTVDENSYLVPLKRKVDASKDHYYFLLKGISAEEKRFLDAATSGKENPFDLLRASLIVEGCKPAKIADYEKQLNRIADLVREKAEANAEIKENKEELTKLVFETLHSELLTGKYDIEATNPAIAFEKGDYNCVSATVIFNSLAKKSGLKVCGLEMSGHVLSRAKYGTHVIDLETTCPNWFSLKSTREKQLATQSRISGGQATHTVAKPLVAGKVDQADDLVQITRKVREISDMQLVAAIYYNQGYDHWQADRLPEAVVATAKALLLDPENENAWGNLIGAINNIALGFSMKEKRHDIAAGLLDQIELIDPNFKDLKSNQYHIYSPWIKELVSARQFDDAKKIYDYAKERLPEEPRMKNLEKLIR